MEKIKKQGLIIWLYTLKNVTQLKKYGYVHYVSDKMKYAVMYVDKSNADDIIEQISKLHYVRNIEVSYMDDVDMTFENSIPKKVEISEDVNEFGQDFFETIAQQLKESSLEE